MWNKKKNTYDSTDVSYQGGMKYGSNIHQAAIKTNQIVWDMIKVLNKKGLFGFHFLSELGTRKTIVNVFHNDKAMLSRAKRELQGFQSIDDLIIIYRVKQKKEKNYVKAAIILLLILATVGLAGAGIGYYLYAQTSFFAPDSQKKSAIVEQFDNNGTKQTIEVDIQMLTALKESFENSLMTSSYDIKSTTFTKSCEYGESRFIYSFFSFLNSRPFIFFTKKLISFSKISLFLELLS